MSPTFPQVAQVALAPAQLHALRLTGFGYRHPGVGLAIRHPARNDARDVPGSGTSSRPSEMLTRLGAAMKEKEEPERKHQSQWTIQGELSTESSRIGSAIINNNSQGSNELLFSVHHSIFKVARRPVRAKLTDGNPNPFQSYKCALYNEGYHEY